MPSQILTDLLTDISFWYSPLSMYQLAVHCDYNASQQVDLKRHKMSVQERIKYSCNQCDYKASQKGNLKRHNLSVHVGV